MLAISLDRLCPASVRADAGRTGNSFGDAFGKALSGGWQNLNPGDFVIAPGGPTP
jgi:hypothetical protein